MKKTSEETEAEDSIRDERGSSSASESIEKEGEIFLQKINYDDQSTAELDPDEYRSQYETLLGALKLAHARESSLVYQCQELHTQKIAGAAELQATLRSSQGAGSQVAALRKDLATVKSLLEAANGREEKAKDTIGKLQEELERLTDLVDKSEIATIRKENEVKSLAKDVDHWKDQANNALEKIEAIQIEHQKGTNQIEQLQTSYNELKDNNITLKDRLTEKEGEIRRGNEQRERLEIELEGTQTKLEFKTKEFIDAQYTAAVAQSKGASLEKQLAESKRVIEGKEQELKEQVGKKQNLVILLDDQKRKTSLITEELRELSLEQKRLTVERNRLVSEEMQLGRNLEAERKAVLWHQQLVEDANAATRVSRAEAEALKKDIDIMRKKEDQLNRDMLMLKRENGLQLGRIQKTEDKVKKTGHDLIHNEQIIVSLEKELAEAKDDTSRQVSLTQRLENDCGGLRHQVTELRASCRRLMDEIKMRESQSRDLTKEVDILGRQVEEQKQQHDIIRNERNNILKQLTDSHTEVEGLEQEQKSLRREIESLRSEVTTKDSALVKENYDYRLEKAQKELFADEISRLKKTMSENEDTIRTLESEVRQLGIAIRKLDDTALLQRKEYDQIINERDILGTQLIRRNDELALLYEKIKILQSTLRRGELQYNARLDDIRLLKVKIRDLQRQLVIARGGQSDVDELTRNLILTQKDLIRERVKVKALTDELENPMNVHRWRKLEGSDPSSYEMVQKIQILQKRLLLKTEEVSLSFLSV